MQFIGEGLSDLEKKELVNAFYANEHHLLQQHYWNEAQHEAILEIKKNIEGMSEQDKKIQAKLQWETWLKKNPKPLIVDQLERLNKKLGIKPLSASDMENGLKEWLANKDKIQESLEKTTARGSLEDYYNRNKEKLDKITKAYGLS